MSLEIYSVGTSEGVRKEWDTRGRKNSGRDAVTGEGWYKHGKFYPNPKNGDHNMLLQKLGYRDRDAMFADGYVRIAVSSGGTSFSLETDHKDSLKDVLVELPASVKNLEVEWWEPEHHHEFISKEDAIDLYAGSFDMFANRKLHKRIVHQGMHISVENRAGSIRTGVTPDGHKWRTKMQHDYGYVKGSRGLDGGGVDCFVGPNPTAKMAYVVHIMKPPTFSAFDEDKCMLGFNSAREAKKAFLAHYDSPKFFGSMEAMPVAEFRKKALHTGAHGPMKIEADLGEPNVYPGGYGHLDVRPTENPPSLKNPKYIPSPSDPRETDDTFLDVSRRHDKATEAFRNRLTKQHPEQNTKPLNKTLITGFPSISIGGFG